MKYTYKPLDHDLTTSQKDAIEGERGQSLGMPLRHVQSACICILYTIYLHWMYKTIYSHFASIIWREPPKSMVWPPPRHIQYKRTSTILSLTARSSYVQANYSKASPCAITWKILPLKAIFSGSSRQTKIDKALQTTHSHFVFQKANSP